MRYIDEARARMPFITKTYELFHRFPEPAHQEIETNRRIREILDEMSVPYDAPSDNITIAYIGKGEKMVGLRADTDALCQTENTGLPFSSENRGYMHACGHDGHITALLTAAGMLKEHEKELPGRVKLIFQPSEERDFGAQEVIATGLVQDVNAFFGIHLWSPYNVGEMRVTSGGVAAGADLFELTIKGKAGHGAMPHESVDAIVCGSELVCQLQTIASRLVSPFEPVVVSICRFDAGTCSNIIAGEAHLEGTIRAFNPDVYEKVHEAFDRIVKNCCESNGCTYDLNMHTSINVVWNDEKLAETARKAALLVDEKGALPDAPFALADDFGDYRAIAPICYARVGIKNEAIGACYPHHSDRFRIDPESLPVAAAWLCEMTCQWLAENA